MSQLPREARVTTNVAPKHYGVSAFNLYDAGRDDADQEVHHKVEDVWKVRKMTWYIEMGDDLLRSRKIEFPFYRAWDHQPSGSDLHFEDKLQESSLLEAPTYPRDGKISLHWT